MRRRRLRAAPPGAALAVLLGALAVAGLAPAAKDDTIFVSRQSAADNGAPGDGASFTPATNGRLVAFASESDNLSTDDNKDFRDVFLRDTATATTTHVSRQSASDGNAAADSASGDPQLSPNGRFVSFSSLATNLTADDVRHKSDPTLETIDVFVRDTQTNTTIYVSRASGANGAGSDGHSDLNDVSDNGVVAFQSNGNTVSPDNTDKGVGGIGPDASDMDVYVRDTQTNTTQLINVRPNGLPAVAANDPSISANGNVVAFASTDDGLSTADNDGFENVYVRDRQAGTTALVSRQGATGANGNSERPDVSADGRFVVFRSNATNLSPDDTSSNQDIYVHDLQTGATTLVSQADFGDEPVVSSGGRFVAYSESGTVLVRDTQANTTTRADLQSEIFGGGFANADSGEPSISPDGDRVAFTSLATNLAIADDKQVADVFLRDLGTTDTTGPQLTLGGKTRQRIVKQKGRFTLTVEVDENASLKVTGTVSGASALKLKKLETVTSPELIANVELKLPKKAFEAVKEALADGERVTAKVKVQAADSGGNKSTEKRKIKLV